MLDVEYYTYGERKNTHTHIKLRFEKDEIGMKRDGEWKKQNQPIQPVYNNVALCSK